MNRIPDEREMEQAVRGWLRDEEEHPADRNRQIGRIMGRVDETRQRRGAWRFLPFGRGAKRVDRDDDELFVAGGAVAMRRGASTAMAIAVVAVLIVIGAALVALVPRATDIGPGAQSRPTTIDEITELNLRAWGGEPELLSESYAPDGVHTATFYDKTNEYVGPEEIDLVAGGASVGLIGPRIEIPAAEGELRWASFSGLGGGTACLLHAVDGRIVRHDCILPEMSSERRATVGLADAEASAAIDEVQARLSGTWGAGASVEQLAAVYAPDAVHSARYLNTTRQYVGPEGIMGVAARSHGVTPIGERVDLQALDGELAWAEVSDVAGGSVCLFRAVDGMITRHDCVLPIRG